MSNVSIFNFNGKQFRTFNNDGEVFFCLADVCSVLEIPNVSQVKSRLNKGGVITNEVGVETGMKKDGTPATQKVEMTFIDEPNFYKTVLQSRKPQAEPFTDYVTKDVLPSIRKHGMYASAETVEKMLSDPDNMIKVLTILKDERQAKERAIAEKESLQLTVECQSKELRIQAPKVEYHDKVLQSDGLIATTTIAKELGMSAVSLNKVLHHLGIIYKSNGTWVLYAKYQNKGYTGTKTTPYTDSLGNACTSIQTYWTEKGRQFIHELSKTKISA